MKNAVLNVINDYPIMRGRVERSLISDTSNGKAYILALDKESSLPPHTAPSDAMLHVLDGKIEFRLGEIFIHLEHNDVIMMRKGSLHSLSAATPSHILLTLFLQDKTED